MSSYSPAQKEQSLSDNFLANSQSHKPLGEILVEAGLISLHQIEIALTEQKQYNCQIGEILANHNWIKQQTADFFAEKWPGLLGKQLTRPLALYLYAAALLDKRQLLVLKQKQIQTKSESRLHSLAVEQGYVKQVTVDFFLRYLFDICHSPHLSFTQPYSIIKKYINGETNFEKLELSQILLNGVSLKGVKLNKSNLRQANLNNSNLSNASLVRANLALAALELATLSHVNFQRACLIEANLRRSNLEQANFQGANLEGADLREANLFHASFCAADLRGAKLEAAYSYDVYYDNQTSFDASFNPQTAGWKLKH